MVSLFAVTVVVAMSFDLVGRFVGYCGWVDVYFGRFVCCYLVWVGDLLCYLCFGLLFGVLCWW